MSSEISRQKCVFNIFVSTIHIHIIHKVLKFYINSHFSVLLKTEPLQVRKSSADL